MQEVGTVVEVRDDLAIVEVERSPACERCGVCHHMLGTNKMVAEARNDAQAKVGEKVNLEIESKIFLTMAFVLYIVPVVFLIIGYFIGSTLVAFLQKPTYSQEVGILSGFIFLGFSYLIIRMIDRRAALSKQLRPVVTEVVKGSRLKVRG